METTWQDRVRDVREFRDASLKKIEPSISGLPDPLPVSSQGLPAQFLTARQLELTQNYDAIELLELLRTKKLTSEELTRAFLCRAVVAQYAVSGIPGPVIS
jgi:amidase